MGRLRISFESQVMVRIFADQSWPSLNQKSPTRLTAQFSPALPELPSVPRLTVYNLFNAARARLTLASMSLAEAVQMKGLGLSLCALMYSPIAPVRSLTL